MNQLPDRKVPTGMFLGIAVLSASLLAFQVLLTRVCALRLAFHFSFLIISNSLLGIAASGTVLTLLESRWRKAPERWVWVCSCMYVASLGFTWWWARSMPVPEMLKFGWTAEEQGQFFRFAIYNLGLAIPFFFGGGAVGLILSAYAHRIHTVYSSDLLGAGLGCLLCPLLLWPIGAGGCLVTVAMLGVGACACVAPPAVRKAAIAGAVAVVAALAFWLPSFDSQFPVPGKKHLLMTQSRGIDLGGPHEYSRWSANSRIDVIKSPLPFWIAYGIGKKDMAFALNPANREALGGQKWIMQDGDAGTFVTDYTNSALAREYLQRTLYSLAASIKRGTSPRVFVIGVGGGPDIWAHKLAGASYIKGIELNRGVLDVHDTVAKEFSRGLKEDPTIELVCDEGRSALMRDASNYGIIQMTGIDTWTSLASGAYVLAENYLYTVEAVQQMYDHLEAGGIIQITRMGANMERLRLLVNIWQALQNRGVTNMANAVAVVAAEVDQLTSVLLRKGDFPEAEVVRLEAFLAETQHTPLYLPRRRLNDNLIERFMGLEDKQAFIADFPRRITPTTDDQPYFFNFTRWDTPTDEAKNLLAEATEVSQGNPLFLWGQLGFSTIVAMLLIVLPLVFRRAAARGHHTWRFLVYFAGIGAGFIFIEIAMLQKLTLLLGQPLYSIVVTLLSILIFTGVGSWMSSRWLSGGMGRVRSVPLGIAVTTVFVVLFGTPIVDLAMGSSLPVRATVAAAMIAPMALLLGMPFVHGVGLLNRLNPQFVPWAWAVNGSATVVGSVVTVVVSMNFGFHAVLLIAVAIYAVAFLAVDKLAR